MRKNRTNLIKLGIFTLSGLVFLVLALYLIGRNQQLFRSSIVVKAYFSNAGGVVPGNNVRYSGIQAGTVKSVKLMNDTTIEFVLLIDKSASRYMMNNSVASIGTEGIIGNKVINILPGSGTGTPIQDGDELRAKKTTDTDAMLETLSVTNQNAALLSAELLTTITRLNNSSSLWSLLEDSIVARSVKISLANIQQASLSTRRLTDSLNLLVADIKEEKGLVNQLVYDTGMTRQLRQTLDQFEFTSRQTVEITQQLNKLVNGVQHEIEEGKGPANAILSDTAMAGSLQRSLRNIEQSTNAFNENMEALKHNFLFRGYFRKKNKKENNK